MLQPWSHCIRAALTVSPEKAQNGDKQAAHCQDHLAVSGCSHHQGRTLRKRRILWGAYQRNDFNEPRLLYLPIQRKALSSLTWYIWFSFIQFSSVEFSCSVMSDSLWPHGLYVACQASLSITNSRSPQTHVHWVGHAIQPSHPLSSPSPAFNLSHYQGLF